MARALYRYDKEKKCLVEINKPKRLEVHNIITDEIPPTESYASIDKPVFTSRSKLMRHYKAKGVECTGGEHLKQTMEVIDKCIAEGREPTARELEGEANAQRREREEHDQRIESIKESVFDVKYDRIQFTEREKELHLREQRRLGKAWTIKMPY